MRYTNISMFTATRSACFDHCGGSMQRDLEEIENLLALLMEHRRRLDFRRRQAAMQGADVRPEVIRDIEEAQQSIRQLKATLRAAGTSVADDPLDEARTIPSPVRLSAADWRDRSAMLARIRAIWITGLLEQSLTNEARIALGLEEWPDAVQPLLNKQVQELRRPPRALVLGTPIRAVFDDVGGDLLILGAPGAGKTTLLLELARDLLDRAEQDPAHRIPVVFNLSSWGTTRPALTVWLVDELNTKYDVPRKIAQAWVNADAVLPLLDGLDEVQQEYRAACVQAINAYQQEHGLAPLVACSRIADYETLTVRLHLRGAVMVQPLTPTQIEAFLNRIGPPLAGLRAMLENDTTLRELAQTPLMLATLSLAYQNMPAEVLVATEVSESPRKRLFDAYVDRMFMRRGAETGYSREQTVQWLVWLAREMTRQGQSIFFIESLQPAWLATPLQRVRYATGDKVVFGAVAGGVSGLIWSLDGGLPGVIPVSDWVVEVLLGGNVNFTLSGLFTGLGTVLIATLCLGIIMALVVRLTVGVSGGIEEVQTVTPYSAARPPRTAVVIGCAVGLVDGLLIGRWNGVTKVLEPGNWAQVPVMLGIGFISAISTGLAAGFIYWRAGAPGMIAPAETVRWSWIEVQRRSPLVLSVALGSGLVLGLVWGLVSDDIWPSLVKALAVDLVAGVMAGFIIGLEGRQIKEKQVPNHGIRRSARTAVVIGCAVWLGMGVLVGLAVALASRFSLVPWAVGVWNRLYASVTWSLINWGIWAMAFGWGAGMLYGGLACIRHLLLRFMLWHEGAMPWNYARFLDYAAERIFLRKIGGGYIFVHRLLLEYFAALNTTQNTSSPPTSSAAGPATP